MSTQLNKFNSIAKVYDALAQLVFGKSIIDAQIAYLPKIAECKNILIIGGGSGLIALRALQLNPQAVITYVEASSEMLAMAKKKTNAFHDRVRFVHGTEMSIQGEGYDAVVTHFFLDLYPAKEINEVISIIRAHVKPGAVWLATDFVDEGKWWQRFMLWTMYRFFTISAAIRAKSLPAWVDALERNLVRNVESQRFYRGFIVAGFFRLSG